MKKDFFGDTLKIITIFLGLLLQSCLTLGGGSPSQGFSLESCEIIGHGLTHLDVKVSHQKSACKNALLAQWPSLQIDEIAYTDSDRLSLWLTGEPELIKQIFNHFNLQPGYFVGRDQLKFELEHHCLGFAVIVTDAPQQTGQYVVNYKGDFRCEAVLKEISTHLDRQITCQHGETTHQLICNSPRGIPSLFSPGPQTYPLNDDF